MGIMVDDAPVADTKEVRVARRIYQLLDTCSTVMINTYESVRNEIYSNLEFVSVVEDFGDPNAIPPIPPTPAVYDSDAVYAAFAAYSDPKIKVKLTPQQLGLAARCLKTIINLFIPGAIVDDVPEVTFTV